MRLRDILLAVTAPVNWALGFTFSKAALGTFPPILPRRCVWRRRDAAGVTVALGRLARVYSGAGPMQAGCDGA